MKTKMAVFFGGRSCEHDISVITAVQAMGFCDTDKYEIYPVYMKDGGFYTGEALRDLKSFESFDGRLHTKVVLEKGAFFTGGKNLRLKKFKPDVALVCCHGGEGENGCLQAILEYNGIPYTSAGILQSAVGMDKIMSKELFSGMMLNNLEFVYLSRKDFLKNRETVLRHTETFLNYPMIVKPSSLGSSIGIKRADNRTELEEAVEVACAFDGRVIVEEALSNFTELNCAAVSDGQSIIISEVERPLTWRDILTFEDKYMGGGKGAQKGGMSGATREMPAKISAENYEKVTETTRRVYDEMGLSGVVRVDYLLSDSDKLFINEINTVPGSLAYYLFEPKGIDYPCLIDILVEGAYNKAGELKKNKIAFQSDVLKTFGGGKTMKAPHKDN